MRLSMPYQSSVYLSTHITNDFVCVLWFIHVQDDESQLLQFLDTKFGKGQTNGPEFFYDPKYALCLCLQEKRMRACVRIYSMMSMHEEAVALALTVNLIPH